MLVERILVFRRDLPPIQRGFLSPPIFPNAPPSGGASTNEDGGRVCGLSGSPPSPLTKLKGCSRPWGSELESPRDRSCFCMSALLLALSRLLDPTSSLLLLRAPKPHAIPSFVFFYASSLYSASLLLLPRFHSRSHLLDYGLLRVGVPLCIPADYRRHDTHVHVFSFFCSTMFLFIYVIQSLFFFLIHN